VSWHEPGPKLAKVQKKLSLASSIHPSPDDYQAAIAELQAEVARLKSAGSALEKAVRGYLGF